MTVYRCSNLICDWAGQRPETTEVKREAYDEETGWYIARDYRAICPKCASDVDSILWLEPATIQTTRGRVQ
jgi:hypothetical protein